MEKTSLSALVDLVKNCSNGGRRYCFILGAGASKASGIKTGAEMSKIWLAEMDEHEGEATREWKEEKKINEDNAATHYSTIYERRFRLDPVSGFIRLQQEMKAAIPSPGYYHLARILSKTKNNVVITTNFDSLTEDSLFIFGEEKALVIPHESLAKYIDILADRPIIIKLHRDVLLQPKSKEKDTKTLPVELKESLKKVLEIYVPIVIGYGGNDDSLMDFLKSVANKDKNIYWCYRDDNPPNEQIQQLLEEYNGFFVPIDNFDDTMLIFGDAFYFGFSEKIVQRATNKRAAKLINQYRELTANRRKELSEKGPLDDTEKMTLDYLKRSTESKIASLKIQIKKNPKNAENYYYLGIEYFWKGKYDDAIEKINKAIVIDPNNAEYHYFHGINKNLKKEYDEAINDLSKAIKFDPDNALYYYRRCKNHSWVNKFEKAITDLSKAIELDPDNASYYTDLARLYCRTDEIDKAFESLNKAMSIYNDLPEFFNIRGYINLKISEHGKEECNKNVIEDLEKAIKLGKEHYFTLRARADRAEYYLYSKKPDEAFRDIKDIIKLDDGYGRAYFLRSWYHKIKGDSQKYEEDKKEAREKKFKPFKDEEELLNN